MMLLMRTTVTLDSDIVVKLKRLAHRRGCSFKVALNEVLRRGLSAQAHAATLDPFVVEPHSGGFRPGIDPVKLNQLVDQLEAEDFVKEARPSR